MTFLRWLRPILARLRWVKEYRELRLTMAGKSRMLSFYRHRTQEYQCMYVTTATRFQFFRTALKAKYPQIEREIGEHLADFILAQEGGKKHA